MGLFSCFSPPYGRSIARPLFVLSLIANFCGICLSLGGLSGLQAFCSANNNSIISGIRPEYATGAQFQFNLGGFSCSRYWRFEWWGWALQVLFFAVVAIMYKARRVYKFRSAMFATGATVTVLNMYFADELLTEYYVTEGILRTRGIITFLGFALCSGANYVLMFTGCALIENRQHAANPSALADAPTPKTASFNDNGLRPEDGTHAV